MTVRQKLVHSVHQRNRGGRFLKNHRPGREPSFAEKAAPGPGRIGGSGPDACVLDHGRFIPGILDCPPELASSTGFPLVFPDRAHDFGNVARGSQVRYAFPMVNRSNYDIHIADWQTKCGCTNVKVGARAIPPGTQTTVEATIDTTRFHGRKDSGSP